MKVNEVKSEVKVWQPIDFTGVEVGLTASSFKPCPKQVLPGFVLVVSQTPSTVLYGHNSKTFDRGFDRSSLFLSMNAGEVYGYDPLPETPVTGACLKLSKEVLSRGNVSESFYFPELTAAPNLNDTLAKLTHDTIRVFDQPNSHLEREAKLLDLVDAVTRYCSDTPPPEPKLGQEHEAVKLVKEVLQTNPELNHRLDDLAALTGLNKHYLVEVFKRDVGASPYLYQVSVRLHRARNLLAQGTTVAQAAANTGFTDQSHLTHVFKKYVRVTPGQFQKDSLDSR